MPNVLLRDRMRHLRITTRVMDQPARHSLIYNNSSQRVVLIGESALEKVR